MKTETLFVTETMFTFPASENAVELVETERIWYPHVTHHIV